MRNKFIENTAADQQHKNNVLLFAQLKISFFSQFTDHGVDRKADKLREP